MCVARRRHVCYLAAMPDDLPPAAPLAPADPGVLGLDAAALAEAVRFARAHETPWPRDLRAHLESGHFEPPPHNAILGPVAPRGGPAGMILRQGRVAASWGDVRRPDMTFSVAKSYLSLLAGLALGDGLIVGLDEPVAARVNSPHFAGARNGAVTWRQLLTLTSEWEGTLWGKSDVIDRNRDLNREGKARKGEARPLRAPGTFWEYNDVRVNALSLALLHLFRRPLAEVFRDRIMDPIGASRDWAWHAYDTARVTIDGVEMPSVPGGGHWGGGVFIGAEDQARIGLLVARRGRWEGRQIVPESWIDAIAEPCPLKPDYGLLWWLNTDGARAPAASRRSLFAVGAGGHVTWIDPERDLVSVTRWLDPAVFAGYAERVVAALRG
ncbi:MAG: serine hydrolase [Elioraea sp.]|nr:MAG: serine hydrolase [Elioraea sp.]